MTRDNVEHSIGSEGVRHEVFMEAYGRDRPAPWETGRVQPAIIDAISRGWLANGPVLDAGCGTGENSVEIARRTGLQVHAVDCVPVALDKAKSCVDSNGFSEQVEIEFHDLRNPTLQQHRYGSILDAGVLHVFSDEDRLRYLEGLGSAIWPGGSLVVVVFSDEEKRGGGPRPPLAGLSGDTFPLGFGSLGSAALDDAGRVLRMLHVRELRRLQDGVNAIVVGMQEFTANPKTDSRLGRVGR